MQPVPVDLDLAITASSSAYVTHVVTSPVGEARGSFELSRSTDEIRATVDELASVALGGTAARAARISLQSLGRELFEALFNGDVYACLWRSLDVAAREGRALRIRLRLGDAPDLIDMPWEFLYFPLRGVFMAADRGTPIVRYLDLADRAQPLLVDLPLRILAVAPSPSDFPELNVDAEREKLEGAVAPLAAADAVTATWANDGTFGGLARALGEVRPHVLHFIGHGEWDPADETGLLQFEAGVQDRRSKGVRSDILAEAFRGSASLRLVVLNACEGARTGARGTFVGVAQALVRAGMPAVVAMQFPITDEAAIHFAEGLYSALGRGDGVDGAVASARHQMLLAQDDIEWATPVLYLRSPDARLFDVGAVQSPPLVAPPVATISTGELIASNAAPDGVRLDRAGQTSAALRPRPVRLLPADFPGLLGREADLAAVTEGLGRGSFAVYGERGIGKSSLLRHLANRLDAGTDVVHLRSKGRPSDDLLQALFEAFYAETQPPLRPSEPQLHHYLGRVDGVVAIDDMTLDREDVDALLDSAPDCRFLITSEDQPLGVAGQSRRLSGLDASAGVALIAADLNRGLSPPEVAVARSIVDAVAGSPARILASIAPVREGIVSLEQLQGPKARHEEPTDDAAARTQRLLGVLGGAPLGIEHIIALAGVTASDLAALERKGLIQAQSPRYALARSAPEGHGTPIQPAVYDLLPYLADWVESRRSTPADVVDEAEAIIAALELAARYERWGEIVRLVRACEDAFFTARRWGQWRVVLTHLETAAEQIGDTREVARVHHQLGSAAGALGYLETGRQYLGTALATRKANGDRAGAALTQHNLAVLESLPPPPHRDKGPGVKPRRPWDRLIRTPLLPLLLAIAGLFIVAVIGAVAVGLLQPPPTPGPTPQLRVDQTRLEFGEVEVGTRTDGQVIVVRNTGTAVAVVAPIAVDPALPDFVIDSDCGGELSVDGSCRIAVSFEATAAGRREADLIVSSDATGDPPRVLLIGFGRPQPGAPAIELDRSTLDFGEVEIGQPASETVRIFSRGETPLQVSAVRGAEEPFDVDTGDCLEREIVTNESCTFTVSFTPSDVLPYVGTVTIESNVSGRPHAVALNGAGAGSASLSVDPTSIDFGAHRRDEPQPPAAVTVSNEGNLPTRIGAISIPDTPKEPDGGAVFEISSNECAEVTINPGDTCRLEVTFDPSLALAEGDKATLTIPQDAGEALTVALSGSALILPELVGEGAAQDYDWRDSAVVVPFSLVVTNSGEMPAASFVIRAWVTPNGGQSAPAPMDDVSGEAERQDGHAVTTREIPSGDSLKMGATVLIPIEDIFVDHEFRLDVRIDDCVAPTDQPPACRIAEFDETNNEVFVGDIRVPGAPE